MSYRFRCSLFVLLLYSLIYGAASARTVEFETTEVSAADVTLSPDGGWLIFTMVGHLFRLSVEGGTSEQLTFGPYYDSEPTISPDGDRVAFTSNRGVQWPVKGAAWREDNVFVLELETGGITQLTHEPWAGGAVWTPDGQAIVYLAFKKLVPPGIMAQVHRIPSSGGEPEILMAEPRAFGSLFYLRDGRLGWTVIEGSFGPALATSIEVMSPHGEVQALRKLKGYADQMVSSPTDDGVYCRHALARGGSFSAPQEMLFLPLPEGDEQRICQTATRPWYWTPRFAVAPDDQTLYLGERGKLWKIALPGGERESISFTAHVKREIEDLTLPARPRLVATASRPPRVVLSPRLSPDGRSLVFAAAGFLWRQPLDGGPAQRLFKGSGFEDWPAFSPDGKQLAFVHTEHGKHEIRVFDFGSGETRTVASGSWDPRWSPDGQRLVFADRLPTERWRVITVDLRDGKEEGVASGQWFPRPHFSPDGRSVHYSDTGTLYKRRLEGQARPEPLTQLTRHLSEALVSPNGEWLAFRRNSEIWVAPMGSGSIKEEDTHQLASEGGNTFTFTPDGSALIYAVGNRVWRHPLEGGEREEIPVRLELWRPAPPPLLLQGVRVLDFETRGFGSETSVFIEGGRIRWIGSEAGHKIPDETVAVDASGRFAIPGLFDMHVHTYGHAARGNQLAFLAYGITSIRVPGSDLSWLNAMVDRSNMNPQPLPRYFFSGEFFWGAYVAPISDLALLIESEEDTRAYARQFKERGAHFLKAYTHLPWALKTVLAEEARRLGLPVAGHGLFADEVIRGIVLGFAVLEHSRPLHDDVLQFLAAAGTRWDPTLSAGRGTPLMLHDEPDRAEEAKFRAFAPDRNFQRLGTRIDAEVIRPRWLENLANVDAGFRRGVRLLAGTDFGYFWGIPLHWELEHLVQAGIPPFEVLRIATQEAAEAVGADDDLGTIEPGKLADIVLLDKNPLDDIKNTQTIWRVIKGGWLYDPEKLRPPESAKMTE